MLDLCALLLLREGMFGFRWNLIVEWREGCISWYVKEQLWALCFYLWQIGCPFSHNFHHKICLVIHKFYLHISLWLIKSHNAVISGFVFEPLHLKICRFMSEYIFDLTHFFGLFPHYQLDVFENVSLHLCSIEHLILHHSQVILCKSLFHLPLKVLEKTLVELDVTF